MAEVVPLKGPLGARIEGLDRAQASQPAVAALLNRALAEHLLVVIPGERMAPEQTLGFSRAFGKPRTQLLRYKHSGETPEISIMVSTLKTDGTTDKTAIRAEDWHTDDSYFAMPAKATLLHAMEIPSRGGSTWFCNMHSVYEALPETLRRRIDGLRSVHGYDTPRARNRPSARTPQEIAETPDVEHPLVRTILRPAARRSISIPTGRTASSGSSGRRAMPCSTSWAAKRASRSTISAMSGRPATSGVGQPRHHAPRHARLSGRRTASCSAC